MSSNAISSAYTAAINSYVRKDLKYGDQQTYVPGAYGEPGFKWDFRHQIPGGPPVEGLFGGPTNVMPDRGCSSTMGIPWSMLWKWRQDIADCDMVKRWPGAW